MGQSVGSFSLVIAECLAVADAVEARPLGGRKPGLERSVEPHR
jgi:hypothetical protein